MLGGQIALGDGDEAREPRLRSQEIVEIGIEAAVAAAVADGKELAVGIEQKAEFHAIEHGLGEIGDRRETMDEPIERRLADFSSASIKGARSHLRPAMLAVREHARYRLAVLGERGQGGHRVQQCGGFVAGQDFGRQQARPRHQQIEILPMARGRTYARPPPRR